VLALVTLLAAGCGSNDAGSTDASGQHAAAGTNGAAGTTGEAGNVGAGGHAGTSGGAAGTTGSGEGGAAAGVSGSGGAITGAGAAAGTTGAAGTSGTLGMGGAGTSGSGAAGAAGGHAGTSGAAGNAGTSGSAGGSGSIPPGYPMPNTANRAMCQSVALTTSAGGAKVCPGGGAGPTCVQCLFGGSTYNETDVATAQGTSEAGNYAVTVTLGGAGTGQTEIDAEANRELTGLVATAAGSSITYSFVVNVRAKEGQPTEDVPAGYPGLDLFFSAPSSAALQVSAIGYALVGAATKPVMIYVASDSTACDQTNIDYAGWGQMLPQFFAPPAGIANYADSGESSASFLGNGAEWGAVKAAMATGDWVFIQFGHNDGNTTSADFQSNITKMVTDARAKGATPVLVSPPARATFSGQTLSSQSSLHSADMKAVATAQNVAYVDLTSITTAWYNQLGPNGWQQYHALGTDKTHTNAAGAVKIAGFVASALSTQKIGVAQYLRP
jgi:lysophospholipase L1-like esterase